MYLTSLHFALKFSICFHIHILPPLHYYTTFFPCPQFLASVLPHSTQYTVSLPPVFVFIPLRFPPVLRVFMSCNDYLLVGLSFSSSRPKAVEPVILSSLLSGICRDWRKIWSVHCCNFSPSV